MENKCNICEKTFKNKYTLVTHQKTAKFCKKLFVEDKENDIKKLKEQLEKKQIEIDESRSIINKIALLHLEHLEELQNKITKQEKGNPIISKEKIINAMTISSSLDGYVNLSLLDSDINRIKKYLDTITTKEFISLLEIEKKVDSIDKNHVHPYLAIQIAQNINPEFSIQVSKWIYSLLRDGIVKL